ncbi:hypothetical protein RF11_07594 [Thelohanellus kitauei]|uniref:Uncharacterized protein n=1 Tax=Thelohanellus kitauei TaxID=669202 RepID=A0A0C2MLI7_THEKT|nr:hypothetical protein RF11_07594 [Thelohanellus kitauei]
MNVKERLATCVDDIEHSLENSSNYQKYYFDSKISRQNPPQIGDFVFRQIPTRSKISKKWESGWRIDELNQKVLKIKNQGGEIKTVSIDNVRQDFKRNRDQSKVNSSWEFPTFSPGVRAVEAPLYQHGRPMRNRRLPEETHLVSRQFKLEGGGNVGYRRNPTKT